MSMARTAQRGNVRAIRPGISIPAQRAEDLESVMLAGLAKSFEDQAYQLAQTQPNSKEHRLALHMQQIGDKLPRNNLRLIVTPTLPRAEWFHDAWRKVRIAQAALELINSQHLYAMHLDGYDQGGRAKALEGDRDDKKAALDLAILDALRTPVTKKGDVLRKQEMIGRREWAEKYRPEWQAIVDEDLARFPTKARKPRAQEGC
jgi:hypothetical protein